jgi:DNA-binding transcriptional ArsR family regulator
MHPEDAAAKAAILKALAHPARIILVDALKRGDRCVGELCGLLEVDPSVVSRHLAQLKRAGIVSERREGVKVIHRLACPCILQALDCTVGVLKAEARRRRVPRGSGGRPG